MSSMVPDDNDVTDDNKDVIITQDGSSSKGIYNNNTTSLY